MTVVETVAEVPLPAVTLAELGATASEKSFAGALVTVSDNDVVCVPVVPEPLIVTG